jgi:thiol:disulfide interchange protein/DsbC/DsbD-like thiol-disulfide interchange protein
MRFPRTIVALFDLLAAAVVLAASLPACAASSSADLPHVHVQLVAPDAQLHPGSNDVGLYFKLESGWHVYWKNPGDAGEPPHIKWTLPEGITAGPMQFPIPKRLPLGPLMDFGYEDEVVFPMKLNVSAGATAGPATLHAKVDWLVCRGSCIPEKTELEITRPIAAAGVPSSATVQPDQGIWARLANGLPQAPPTNLKIGFAPTASGFRLTVNTGARETEASFFPATPDILSNPAPQSVTSNVTGLTLDLKKDENLAANPKELDGLLTLSGGRAYELIVPAGVPKAAKAVPAEGAAPAPAVNASNEPGGVNSASTTNSANPAGIANPAKTGIFRAAGLAFLGGLILNLMPCVFPVLFIKGLSLLQSGAVERHKLRIHGFVYTAGILVSFWALVGVLLGLRSAGAHLGWGFQFQSPVFLSLMAALLFFLGLSLAGQFEIGLTLTSAGGSLAAKQGYTGSFFTGVLAVIVATPCTAPFMGVALGYALSQTAAVTFAIFTALALGLAAPYVALTLQPAWTRILPRPGPWMEVLKQAVSIPIFGTVIWLAWVVANAYGAALLAALLASFLLLAIAGWFLGRWPAKRWSATLAALIALCVVCLSVYASNSTPSQKDLESIADRIREGEIASATSWQPWSADAVARYQSQGRPVFVDFTASWCLSCQVNERVVLGKPEVQKAFADANVVLMRADWTRYDDNITRALNSFGRSGVPTYALYVPGESQPRLLPEVLTIGIVTNAIAQLPHSSTQTAAAASNQQ